MRAARRVATVAVAAIGLTLLGSTLAAVIRGHDPGVTSPAGLGAHRPNRVRHVVALTPHPAGSGPTDTRSDEPGQTGPGPGGTDPTGPGPVGSAADASSAQPAATATTGAPPHLDESHADDETGPDAPPDDVGDPFRDAPADPGTTSGSDPVVGPTDAPADGDYVG